MALRSIDYERLPSRSDPSAFSFTVEYDPFVESPSRLFRSTAQLIEAFGTLDAAFAASIDSNIETKIILLGLEAGSIRTWLASVLRSVDDEALKELDWKKLIGAYLVRAKRVALEWLEDGDRQKTLADLQQMVQDEAKETDVLHIPAYHPPSRALLIDGLRKTQMAKEALLDSDQITFQSTDGSVDLDPNIRFDLSQLSDVDIASRQSFELNRSSLTVKKPDYLGHSQWQLRLREKSVPATIADLNWLSRFQAREVVLKPGDALICDGDMTIYFDRSGAPVSEKVTVTKVHGIEYQALPQDSFL